MFTSPNRGDQGPNQYRTQDLVKGVGSVIFFWDFTDVVKQSWASKVSQYWPGSRAHLRALEAPAF